MKILRLVSNQYFWLALILIFGFIVRLYKIDSPIADWHSWRQADTAAVARNFYQEGFNPFLPKGDDMSPPGTNKPNFDRYRFVEFPIYNSLVYFVYLLNGGVDERLARLVSSIISLGSAVFLFFIVERYWGKLFGLVSAFVFTFLPFNIYFSRTTLPEPTLVFFCLGMFYFTDRWIWEESRRWFLSSVVFTAIAFLIKPTAFFYFLPFFYSYWKKEKKIWPIPIKYLFWLFFSFAPIVGWRIWIMRYPEGIPAFWWLLDGDKIRFRPAFWRWIIGERLGKEILTVSGFALFIIGALKKIEKEGFILHLLLLSSLLYVIIFATGNVRHDYYQVLIVPTLSIFLARGFILLIQGINGLVARFWTIPLAILLFILVFYFGWNEVKGLYQINNDAIIKAGRVADKILPSDAIVLAPYGGDTAFLYQINRPGWPMQTAPIEEMISDYGITHFVSVNFNGATKDILKKYRVLIQTPEFVIIDLTQPKR